MIRLTLCAINGEQIAPVWNAPRWQAIGGDLHDFAQAGDRPTLRDGQNRFRAYQAKLSGNELTELERKLVAREALALAAAIADLCRQRRAAGYACPEDADRARVQA